MRGCKNVVVSSVMEVFVRSEEYRKAYDSIESDMNVVQIQTRKAKLTLN